MFQSLDDCLQQSLQDWQVDTIVDAHRIIAYWQNIVGPMIAAETEIQKVEDGILYVNVSTSQWMQELQMLKRMIVRKINEWYGHAVIKDIRYAMRRYSNIKKKTSSVAVLDHIEIPSNDFIPMHRYAIPKDYLQYIDAKLERVSDANLRQVLRQLQVDQIKKNYFLQQKGHKRCPQCQQWMVNDKRKICVSCEQDNHQRALSRVKQALKQYPYGKYEMIARIVPCSLSLFSEAKRSLIHEYRERVHLGENDKQVRYMLTMLITQKPADQLTDLFVENLCNKYVSKFIDR